MDVNPEPTTSQSGSEQALHPSAGARFLFERESEAADGQHAGYRAVIFTPEERFEYNADMRVDGGVELRARGPAASAELEAKLATMARLMARDAARKRADDLPPWPHRVLRWRGPNR
jgi:hypothetical protein